MKKTVIVALIMALAMAGCKQVAEESGNTDKMMMMEVTEMPSSFIADTTNYSSGHTDNTDGDYGQKVIKNANLRFESSDLDATAKTIQAAVAKYNGMVQQDSENKDYNSLSRTLNIRIPSKNFESFIADISKGVSYFDLKEITAQDVTEEYIDLSARIKAKKALEARYLELLKKAGKVSEMLEIEKELSAVREEIESQEGRLRYMQNHVAMSTVAITFYKNMEHEPGATVSYGSKMGTALKSGFNTLSSFFIGLLEFWPFILIFVVVIIILRRGIRRRRKI